jgi:hypothetical protein
MVSGAAFLNCAGCTGADGWDDSDADATGQNWESLAGYSCYTYIPAAIVNSGLPAPLLVALHDESEDCLANIQRWQGAAENKSFQICSVNWDAEIADRVQLAADLVSIATAFGAAHQVDETMLCLSGRGAATPIVWSALCELAGNWHGAALLGGVPTGDWVNDSASAMAHMLPAAAGRQIYYCIGTQDSEYGQAVAFDTAMQGANMNIQTEVFPDTSVNSVSLSFGEVWDQISG